MTQACHPLYCVAGVFGSGGGAGGSASGGGGAGVGWNKVFTQFRTDKNNKKRIIAKPDMIPIVSQAVTRITVIACRTLSGVSGSKGSPSSGLADGTPLYVLVPPSWMPSAPAIAASAQPALGLGCLRPSRQPIRSAWPPPCPAQ